MVNTRNGWKLVTFDLDLGPRVLFLYFLIQAVPFRQLYVATLSFYVMKTDLSKQSKLSLVLLLAS